MTLTTSQFDIISLPPPDLPTQRGNVKFNNHYLNGYYMLQKASVVNGFGYWNTIYTRNNKIFIKNFLNFFA